MASVSGKTPASEEISEALLGLKEQLSVDGRPPQQYQAPGNASTSAVPCDQVKVGDAVASASGNPQQRLSVDVPENARESLLDQPPDLSPVGGVLDAPMSPFFDGSPVAASVADSRDSEAAHCASSEIMSAPSQVADSDALRQFLQGAEARAADASRRLKAAQDRFTELVKFFGQPVQEELKVCLLVCHLGYRYHGLNVSLRMWIGS